MSTAEQSAIRALKTALTAKLTGVTVSDRWPEPCVPLAPKALTILAAGERRDLLIDPELDRKTVDGGIVHCFWTVAYIEQPIQIDIWATSHAKREQVIAAFDAARRTNPWENTIDVTLSDGWTGSAEFMFWGLTRSESPASARPVEFRATFRGRATMTLTIAADSPKLARIKLKEKLAAASNALLVATVTGTTATITAE